MLRKLRHYSNLQKRRKDYLITWLTKKKNCVGNLKIAKFIASIPYNMSKTRNFNREYQPPLVTVILSTEGAKLVILLKITIIYPITATLGINAAHDANCQGLLLQDQIKSSYSSNSGYLLL